MNIAPHVFAKLKELVTNALRGSSSQRPVDTADLYQFGCAEHVEAALMALYADNAVCCCKITRRGAERVVWWLPAGAAGMRGGTSPWTIWRGEKIG